MPGKYTMARTGQATQFQYKPLHKPSQLIYGKQLHQQLAADCPSLQVEHAMYLGAELQKAEMALVRAIAYEQDKYSVFWSL